MARYDDAMMQTSKRFLVSCHRGCTERAPENTVAAARDARRAPTVNRHTLVALSPLPGRVVFSRHQLSRGCLCIPREGSSPIPILMKLAQSPHFSKPILRHGAGQDTAECPRDRAQSPRFPAPGTTVPRRFPGQSRIPGAPTRPV